MTASTISDTEAPAAQGTSLTTLRLQQQLIDQIQISHVMEVILRLRKIAVCLRTVKDIHGVRNADAKGFRQQAYHPAVFHLKQRRINKLAHSEGLRTDKTQEPVNYFLVMYADLIVWFFIRKPGERLCLWQKTCRVQLNRIENRGYSISPWQGRRIG